LIFAILSRISEKWNHRCDTISARAPSRVHHDEQLHQVLIRWRTGRLNDENIAAANVFLDLHVGLAIGERAYGCGSERDTNYVTDPLRQLAISGTTEDLHFGLEREHNFDGRSLCNAAQLLAIANGEDSRFSILECFNPVAQVSPAGAGLYRRLLSGMTLEKLSRSADLEICDTADLEVCATSLRK
jgi:hypothetical protein